MLGFNWEFQPQFHISAVDIETRVQVRNVGNVAPADMVKQYAVSMRYDQFPPIVVTTDNKVIDGNTRVAAKKKMGGDLFLPAIVIKSDFNKADGRTQKKLSHLGYRLNSSNGKPLDKAEVLRHARIMVSLGLRVEEIGKDGINETRVRGIKQEMAAEAKLQNCGLNIKFSDNDAEWQIDGKPVKATTMRSLGKQQNLNLPDQPYAELADLAVKAMLPDKDIMSLSKFAINKGSEAGMLEVIRAEHSRLRDRRNEIELCGKVPPKSNSDMLWVWLKGLVNLRGVEDTAVETDPALSAERIELLSGAIAVLTEIRRIQGL
jgi:hypothetical protein